MTHKWPFEIILLKEKLNRKPIHHLRAVLFIFIFLLSFACQALAQVSPQIRRLPPSLERELKLRHGGKIRIVGFVDTLKAQNIIAQSIRDSASEELDSLTVKDSAIIMIDSSVSLNDKEWLDSMLAQLPEYKMTPEGIRFYYPADILIETNRKVVPADTTLPSKMDPVTKEDLPLYSELPMPKPFQKIELPRTSFELGAGFPYLPRVDARSLVLSNEKSAVEVNGKFKTTSASEPAIKQYWHIGASGSFAFPDAAMPVSEQTPELDATLEMGENNRVLLTSLDSAAHSLIEINGFTAFSLGNPESLKLVAHAGFGYLKDEIPAALSDVITTSLSETHLNIYLSLAKNISSSIQLEPSLEFQQASNLRATTSNYSPSLFQARVSVIGKETEIQWKAGISYLGGQDASGSVTKFSPFLSLRTHLSDRFEIGAGFEPQNYMVGLHDLYAQNLFYNHAFSEYLVSDERRVVSEPIHINVFANFFSSLDNQLHAEIRYIQRNNEPVFWGYINNKAQTLFIPVPGNTYHWEFEWGGSAKYFHRDLLRLNGVIRLAYYRDSSVRLPFIPIELHADYEFHLWEKFLPSIELRELVRAGMKSFFLNFDAKYTLSPKFLLRFRAENIFGSAGDFWPGYNEYPRSIWLSGQYNF
jgi:hypothetical protein